MRLKNVIAEGNKELLSVTGNVCSISRKLQVSGILLHGKIGFQWKLKQSRQVFLKSFEDTVLVIENWAGLRVSCELI